MLCVLDGYAKLVHRRLRCVNKVFDAIGPGFPTLTKLTWLDWVSKFAIRVTVWSIVGLSFTIACSTVLELMVASQRFLHQYPKHWALVCCLHGYLLDMLVQLRATMLELWLGMLVNLRCQGWKG